MWNYVFLQAYLDFKEKTEFDGNESYLYNKIQSNDLNWFPIKRLIIFTITYLSFLRTIAFENEEDESNEILQYAEEIRNSVFNFLNKLKFDKEKF